MNAPVASPTLNESLDRLVQVLEQTEALDELAGLTRLVGRVAPTRHEGLLGEVEAEHQRQLWGAFADIIQAVHELRQVRSGDQA